MKHNWDSRNFFQFSLIMFQGQRKDCDATGIHHIFHCALSYFLILHGTPGISIFSLLLTERFARTFIRVTSWRFMFRERTRSLASFQDVRLVWLKVKSKSTSLFLEIRSCPRHFLHVESSWSTVSSFSTVPLVSSLPPEGRLNPNLANSQDAGSNLRALEIDPLRIQVPC